MVTLVRWNEYLKLAIDLLIATITVTKQNTMAINLA
jgi:hypothetical protein